MDHSAIYEVAGYDPGDETPYLGEDIVGDYVGDGYVGDEYVGDDYVGDDYGVELAGYDEVGAPIFRPRRRFRGQYPRNVGRLQRGAYNRTVALRARQQAQRAALQARQAAQAMSAQRAALSAQRAALATGKPVKFVTDDLLIITATSSSAGPVSKTHISAHEYHVQKITFDGSSNGAEVTGLSIGKEYVLGPFSGDDALPASAFAATSQQALSLKGTEIDRADTVVLNGTIANANDKLKAILYVRRVVKGPGCN